MKTLHIFSFLLLLGFILNGCSTSQKTQPLQFSTTSGDPYFDSYYLYLTDTTLGSVPKMREYLAQTQSPEISALIAQVFYSHQQLDSALHYARKSYSTDSALVYTQKYFALLEETGQDAPTLLRLAHRLNTLDSTEPQHAYSLLMAYIRNNLFDSAIRYGRTHQDYFRRYIEIDRLLINLYMQKEQPDSALRIAQDLLAMHPNDVEYLFLASSVAGQCSDSALYKEYFYKALKYGCPNTLFINTYAQFMLQTRQENEFLQKLDTILVNCHYPTSWIVELLQNLRFTLRHEIVTQPTGANLFQRFEQLLDSSENGQFLLLQYYKRFDDTTKILTSIEKNCKRFQPSYLWEVIRVSETLKYQPIPTVNEWKAVAPKIRDNITRYPFDLFFAFSYFESLRPFLDSTQCIDSVTYYIEQFNRLLKDAKPEETYHFAVTFQRDTILQRTTILRENLSRLYGYRGDISAKNEYAFRSYQEALKYDKNNSVVLNNYAYNLALTSDKDLKKALRMSERSLELDPKNINYLDTYGYILYKLKRYQEAKAIFVKLLTLSPNPDRTALLHYSDILEALGNKGAAEVYRMKAEKSE